MKTQLTHSSSRRSAPVRRFNILPLVAILTLGAVGAVLVMLFPADWVRAPEVSISVERVAISPNGDGNLDTVPVLYSLSSEATVTVDVLDEHHTVVRTLLGAEQQAAGQHTVVWDGLDRLGRTLPDGSYFVRVTAQATVQKSSATAQVDIDTEPPIIRLANLPEDTEVGADEGELVIEGVTDPDATVWLNDWPQPLEVNENGAFSVRYTLQEGVNRIELTAVDEAGNQASLVREVTLLTEPPKVTVLNPPDGLWINQQMLSVQGTVEPGVKVLVNGREADVDAAGNFNEDVVLEEGENIVRVEAVDAVGNVSVDERRVFLRTKPPALSLTTVQDGMKVSEPSLLVVGQTEPQATVRLNGQELTVDSQGGFQGLVDLIAGKNIIRVEATDRAGNTQVVVREVTYTTGETALAQSEAGIPPAVRTVLAVTGAGLIGVVGLWLISGLWRRPLSLELRATRPTLTPGVGDMLEPAVVAFEISRPATVTAEVWDAENRHVATVFRHQRRAKGEHLLVWNGRDRDGNLSPPGTYEVEVSAGTLFTTVSSSTHVWIEDTTPRPAWEQSRPARTENLDLGED